MLLVINTFELHSIVCVSCYLDRTHFIHVIFIYPSVAMPNSIQTTLDQLKSRWGYILAESRWTTYIQLNLIYVVYFGSCLIQA